MAEMKTLNGYEVVDAKARQDIAELQNKELDLSNYYTKEETDELISNINECDTYFFDTRELVFDLGRGGTFARLPEHMVEFVTRLLAGEHVAVVIFDEDIGRLMPAEYLATEDSAVFIERVLSGMDATSQPPSTTQWKLSYDSTYECWCCSKFFTHTNHLATTDYVDTAIQTALESIPIAEEASF